MSSKSGNTNRRSQGLGDLSASLIPSGNKLGVHYARCGILFVKKKKLRCRRTRSPNTAIEKRTHQ